MATGWHRLGVRLSRAGASWKQVEVRRGLAVRASVGISGTTAVVGAYGTSTGGEALVYDVGAARR